MSLPNPRSTSGAAAEEKFSAASVAVSIPYYRCKSSIRRAVESILGQTYTQLRVIVVNDGDPDPPWDALADIRDPRLVCFDLPVNRRRYFAYAVVLNAISEPYFLIQDADDWSEPDRLARRMQALHEQRADAAVSSFYRYELESGRRVLRNLHERVRGHADRDGGARSEDRRHHGSNA